MAGLGGAGIGGGGGARRLRYFLLCGLAGLLEVLGGVVARHLINLFEKGCCTAACALYHDV